jgi:hypothetical protein
LRVLKEEGEEEEGLGLFTSTLGIFVKLKKKMMTDP